MEGLHDFGGAINWLYRRGVSPETIAELFGQKPESIPVIAHRERKQKNRRRARRVLEDASEVASASEEFLIRDTDNKPSPLNPYARDLPSPSVAELEEEVADFEKVFWAKVANAQGRRELGLLLRKVGWRSTENVILGRLSARIRHLRAELEVHAGNSTSALEAGIIAYREQEAVYRATLDKHDLHRLGKTCLLISHSHIRRHDWQDGLAWLRRANAAFEIAGLGVDPEYHRQLATVAARRGDEDAAIKNYELARDLLPIYKPSAPTHEVRDVGERSLNLMGRQVKWEAAFELKDEARRSYPAYDIHHAINVNWAAAAGLSSDSPEAQNRAVKLLEDEGHLSDGFAHPATVTFLLKMTPALPAKLRRNWARFASSYNAFRNR